MSIKQTTDESLFYCDVDRNSQTELFIDQLREYSNTHSKQVYILKRILGSKKSYEYNLKDIAIILIPKHSIIILNYGIESNDTFDDYRLDFIEDLGHLSDKFEYTKILGRARKWPEYLIKNLNIKDFDVTEYIADEIAIYNQRKIDLLISLLIGSINSIDNIGLEEPETLLDRVKQKIILFDGKQSRFIYETADKDIVTIQGMAGTGKTELLLHKLKDVYANSKDTTIAFTCFNKVLANDMKTRIPRFFNFMKVDEQIEWGSRLHVFSSWGSYSEPESGMYSYICNKYKLPFRNYGENRNFDELCKLALEKLNQMEDFSPCFDYIFIDESQDFSDNFFELCKKSCKKTVYIAGDIFQNIFDADIKTDVQPTYLLNKCYRTDPKTLMFAHAVGMGLYEKHPLNWLEDTGWEFCGYSYERINNSFKLSRSPLRRFEDLNATNTIRLLPCDSESYCGEILSCIKSIKDENANVQADDIAVIILGNYRNMSKIADTIEFELYDKYKWKSSKGYETKVKESGRVYISNINNIKGLEFPFVICVVPGSISDDIKYRNSIYMALTRSFLTSYFIVDYNNEEFISTYQGAITDITNYGYMTLNEPSEEEKKQMALKIKITLTNQKRSLSDILEELYKVEYPNLRKKR
ncbi:MAG: AAA family ATPase [Anaeromusa sp.]|uniref:DEAD/DEAH box helicase n=1 Tax=Anaeromusa sp. TaxID=1872520 RepID=UPI002B1FC1B7|nr:ATP-binding domain-containing protein [Anaeromusa sp.]MEA4836284.1 AAA family ATPase [Anaeromusa sp.]